MTKKAAAPKAVDSQANLLDLMALMIWKMRHHLPGPIIQITQADKLAMDQSLAYNEQTLKVNIEDRNGTTLIHLTDTEGNQIIATENNEADLDRAQAAANLRQHRQTVQELAPLVVNQARMGDMSLSTIEDLCNAALAIAK